MSVSTLSYVISVLDLDQKIYYMFKLPIPQSAHPGPSVQYHFLKSELSISIIF